MFVCDDKLITFWKRNGPPRSLAEGRAVPWCCWRHPWSVVGTDVREVERRLRAGGLLARAGESSCCVGARPRRRVRQVGELRPRRARCGRCLVTHVLLTVSCLLRQADAVEVIGAALRMKAIGAGHRPIATRLARPASTVRGWLRAFMCNAEMVRSVFTALLIAARSAQRSAAEPSRVFADAVEAVGACVAAGRRRLWACSARCAVAAGFTQSRTAASLLRAVPQS